MAQWLEVSAPDRKEVADDESHGEAKAASKPKSGSPSRGLTYHEKQESAGMEERLLAAEETVGMLEALLNDPDVAGDHERLHTRHEAHRSRQ